MKKKGFTLVELLVVIAIIALLMGILMPALSRVRQLAHRLVCGTNLSGIGKAMLIYANDNEEDYPIAGPIGAQWDTDGSLQDWVGPTRDDAFGWAGGTATISSSLFLLVKYGGVTAKQFVCKGDAGTRTFDLSGYLPLPAYIQSIEDPWDFGSALLGEGMGSSFHNSYSFQMPYQHAAASAFPITGSSSPESPVAADRNPWLDSNAQVYIRDSDDVPAVEWRDGYKDPGALALSTTEKYGNAAAHQREGQNVLFNDSHVNFERYPNVGIEKDNIWRHWSTTDYPDAEGRQVGYHIEANRPTTLGVGGPMANEDAFLVNEYNGNILTDLPF